MRNQDLLMFLILSMVVMLLAACEDDIDMVCFPNTYACGGTGDTKTILMRCDSTTERWEVLRDCAEKDQICYNGACTSPDGDNENVEETEDR